MTDLRWPPSTTEHGEAACLSIPLEIVDAAFDRPGGPEGHWMRANACSGCPIALHCLAYAMDHFEPGVWGGTSSNMRTRHGAPHHPNFTPKTKAG